jgi:hypothetical protein
LYALLLENLREVVHAVECVRVVVAEHPLLEHERLPVQCLMRTRVCIETILT